MKLYQNIMEPIVEEQFDALKDTLGCCTCEQCRSDILAFALNHLPPRYVATTKGGVITKADSLRIQHMADIRTALIQAAQVVKEHPRH